MAAPELRVLSLGAGVQSTTLALMAARGEFSERLDAAIFADTQWEPAAVYRHLAWLRARLPFPVLDNTAGNLRADIEARRDTTQGRFASVPWFLKTVIPKGTKVPIYEECDDGDERIVGYRLTTKDTVKLGMGRRQCTSEYKLKPIMWKIRELLGVSRRGYIKPGTVEQWVGITTDEASRMKDARQRYIVTRWPLIERRMSRSDCERWIESHGYPPAPRSACIGCPFHSQEHWQRMRDEQPDEFAEACRIDAALRVGNSRGVKAVEFMHPARIPLREAVELSVKPNQPNLFENECMGLCGV